MIHNDFDERDIAERKKLVKDAIDEWLEHKYATVGRWTIAGLSAAIVAIIGYYFFMTHGVR